MSVKGSSDSSGRATPREIPINEKAPRVVTSAGDDGAHVLDIDQLGEVGDVKTAPDGHTVLIPQPSSDPNDPLNWSPFKKHIILFVISVVAFMPDFGSSIGVVTLLPQAKYVQSVCSFLKVWR